MRILIADDEPIALDRLIGLFGAIPDVEIVGCAHDGAEAARMIEALGPDIAFLDIGMPHRSGLDVARSLTTAMGSKTEVVFVTAFNQFAAEAFDLDAVDYLLKPVSADRLLAAIRRAQRRALSTAAAHTLQQRLQEQQTEQDYLTEIWVKQRNGLLRVDIGDIEWIEAAGDYVLIHTAERSHIQRITMEALQRQLDPLAIMRVSRSAFVRRGAVARVERVSRSALNLILSDQTAIAVGHTYAQAVSRTFGLKGNAPG
jgi:DNA-binding LytR/AlgR family response regulator